MPFNYNINWLKIIYENLAIDLQNIGRVTWIQSLISPFQAIYASFLQAKSDFIYKAQFNSQIEYLEMLLNDKFDPTARRIYIENTGSSTLFWVYQKAESKPPIYIYNRWKSATTYTANQYAVENNRVYVALVTTTGEQPSLNPTKWAYYKNVQYLRRRSEFVTSYDFTVYVPLGLPFNDSSMRAQIDYYRFLSKMYQIVLF
ncbi:MAG TPA: hypothetical protein VN698_12350 [Bacteroidia bacterium]|nr:hypothetical protein [Bacteroidia bacterium]